MRSPCDSDDTVVLTVPVVTSPFDDAAVSRWAARQPGCEWVEVPIHVQHHCPRGPVDSNRAAEIQREATDPQCRVIEPDLVVGQTCAQGAAYRDWHIEERCVGRRELQRDARR